jgi:hypothetical protein
MKEKCYGHKSETGESLESDHWNRYLADFVLAISLSQ